MRAGRLRTQERGEVVAMKRVKRLEKFLAVCRSQTPAEKTLFLDLWQREEDRIAGGLP
jgi:hypothetical protein